MAEPLYSDESPEDRAFDALIVEAMRHDPKHLPELTEEERAAMEALPPFDEMIRRAETR